MDNCSFLLHPGIKFKLFLDKDLRTIYHEEWDKLRKDIDYTIIGRTRINNYVISTVWTGIYQDKSPFETIIFNSEGEIYGPIIRHSSQQEAQEFHLCSVRDCQTLMSYDRLDLYIKTEKENENEEDCVKSE